jgi:hypothetical protein
MYVTYHFWRGLNQGSLPLRRGWRVPNLAAQFEESRSYLELPHETYGYSSAFLVVQSILESKRLVRREDQETGVVQESMRLILVGQSQPPGKGRA